MRRRELIVLVAAAASLRWPTGHAQQPGWVYRVGRLGPPLPSNDPMRLRMFDELRRSGFVEGQNLHYDMPYVVGSEAAAKAAAAMVSGGVDAVYAGGPQYARIMQQATQTIPIVAVAEDLVVSGLVTSLAHPGGNTTGISILATELDGKRQELLTELVPMARHIAALADPAATPPAQLRTLADAARARGIELTVEHTGSPEEIAPAIAAAQASGAQGLNVLGSPLLNANLTEILARTAALKLPAIYQWPETAEAGGLAAYGPRYADIGRQAGGLLVKILRGAKPADLPVEQPYKFEFVVNLQTARAIGLTVPPIMLAQADKVIE